MAKLAGLAVARELRSEKTGAAMRGPLHQVPPWVESEVLPRGGSGVISCGNLVVDDRISNIREVGEVRAELLRLAVFLLGGSSKVGFPHQEAEHRCHNLKDHTLILHCKHHNVNTLAAFPCVMLNFSHTSDAKILRITRAIRRPKDPPEFQLCNVQFRFLCWKRAHFRGQPLPSSGENSLQPGGNFAPRGGGDMSTPCPRGQRAKNAFEISRALLPSTRFLG